MKYSSFASFGRLAAIALVLLAILTFVQPAQAVGPFINDPGTVDCYEGLECVIVLNANDGDNDPMTFSLPAAPAGMTINAVGVIRWTPTLAQAQTGDHAVTARVTANGENFDRNFNVRAWRTILSTHFRTRWWKTAVTDAYAQVVSSAMENSWNVEINNYNYRLPPNTAPAYFWQAYTRIDVYIHALAGGSLGETSPASNGNPPTIEMDDNVAPESQLQATCAHEFYHAIQNAYDWNETWIDEASARWMQDEVYDDANTGYIAGLADNTALLANPTTYMLNTYNYGGCVYPNALSEIESDDFIRKMWEGSIGAGTFIQATVDELGGDDDWAEFWEKFAYYNYAVENYTEGSTWGTRAKIDKDYLTANNAHFIYSGATYPPVVTLGDKLDAAAFPKYTANLPGLATYYLRFQVPAQVRNGNTVNTELFLYFDGADNTTWSVDAYGVKNNGTIHNREWELVDPDDNNANRTGSISIPFGGTGAADYKEVILIIGNLARNNTNRAFEVSAALVPVFQAVYGINPATGSTTTVSNEESWKDANNEGPDEDNIYKNGDTIEFEVNLSGPAHLGNSPIARDKRSLKVDFTLVDSNFTPPARSDAEREPNVPLEEVTAVGGNAWQYTVKYVISASNAWDGKRREDLPITVEVMDLSLMDPDKKHVDETFKITIDNELPAVKQVIITQGSKTVYDSGAGIAAMLSGPTIDWAMAGTIQVKVIFNESMQKDEVDGTDVDPEISFGLVAPFTQHKIVRSSGWATTTYPNDTWNGTYTIPPDQGAQYDGTNTLSIRARDQAGNWLDQSAGMRTPDTSHVLKIDSTAPSIGFSKEYFGSQECPDLRLVFTVKDELNGSMDPAKVSGLALVQRIVTPPGGMIKVEEPSNPFQFTVIVPSKKSVSVVVLGEDKAGNIKAKGESFTNNFPGCDKPDENLSVASPLASILDRQVAEVSGRRVEAMIAVLNNGFADMARGFISQFGEPTTLVETDFDPAIVEDFPVLVIPSGGLYGLDSSVVFRSRLERYVESGGTIIAFDQQHGYEYGALPGGELGGYGWVEDNSCHSASLFISDYQQFLSGFSQPKLTTRVDGFFTGYPEDALTPLNRTQNGFPGLVVYPYGLGWVVATTIYDDFGTFNRQATTDAHILARDLISWALDPAAMPEYKPGAPVSIPITLMNESPYTATQVQLTILNPARTPSGQQTLPVNIPPGGSQVVQFSTTASASMLGIWWVDTTLQGSPAGRTFEPIQDQMRGGRFVVSNPPASSGPGKQLGLSVTAPNESFIKGSLGVFTFHAVNFTSETKNVTVAYGFPHHTWESGNQAYGNFSSLSHDLSIPPAVTYFNRDTLQTEFVPGEATFTHSAVMFTTDRLFAYLYYNGSQVDQNWFKIWRADPSVAVSVLPDDPVVVKGNTTGVEVLVGNLTNAVYTSTAEIKVYDGKNQVIHSETQPFPLGPMEIVTSTIQLVVPPTASSGVARIDVEVKDPFGQVVGAGTGTFEIPASPLSFKVAMPTSLTPGQQAIATVEVTNQSLLLEVTGAQLSASLFDPAKVLLVDLGTQTYTIGPDSKVQIQFAFIAPDPTFGKYKLKFTSEDLFGTGTWEEAVASQVLVTGRFDENAFRVRENLTGEIQLVNAGVFVEHLVVTATTHGVDFTATANQIQPSGIYTFAFSIPLAGDLAAGKHTLAIQAQQPGGGLVTKNLEYMIAASNLSLVFPPSQAARLSPLPSRDAQAQADLQAGQPFTATLLNTGGSDTTADVTFNVTTLDGISVVDHLLHTGSVVAGGNIQVSQVLPEDIATARYLLQVTVKDNQSSIQKQYRYMVWVSGQHAEMVNFTNSDFYLKIDPVTATVVITNTDGLLDNALLTIQVLAETPIKDSSRSVLEPSRGEPAVIVPGERTTTGDTSSEPGVSIQLADVRSAEQSPDVLVLYTISLDYSVFQALDSLGIAYDAVNTTYFDSQDLTAYQFVIIAMDGGFVEQPAMAAVAEAVNNGVRLIGLGGSNYSSFVQGVNTNLFSVKTNDHAWQISSTPHFTVLKPASVFTKDLPSPFNFSNSSAAYYQLRTIDPDVEVLAKNADNWPVLIYKQLGNGEVLWFTNSPQSGYWYNNQTFFTTLLRNAFDGLSGKVIWEKEIPVTIGPLQTTTVITEVVPLTATGKLYLQSFLNNERSQLVGFAGRDDFYIFPGLTFLTVKTPEAFQKAGTSMLVSGIMRNARTTRDPMALSFTTNLTVTLDGEVIYTQPGINLAPGATVPYSFLTTAPLEPGSVLLVAEMDDITGTVRTTATVDIEVPEIHAELEMPDMVGQAPFTGTLVLENIGVVPGSLQFAVTSEGTRSPLWEGSLTLQNGDAVRLVHDFQITQDTSFEVSITGEYTETLSDWVDFGEDASTKMTLDSVYQAGVIEIPYLVENTGALETSFTTTITLERHTSLRSPAFEVVDIQALKFYLPAPPAGGVVRVLSSLPNIEGTLVYDLPLGNYRLAYANIFEQGAYVFTILGTDRVIIEPETEVKSEETLPVTVTLLNVGSNQFTGTLQVQAYTLEGGRDGAPEPWASAVQEVSVEPGAVIADEVTIGNASKVISHPFYNYYENERSQILYLGSEIGTSGVISKIAFYLNHMTADVNYRLLRNLTIRLGQTSRTDLNLMDFVGDVAMTPVFGPVDYTMPPDVGWVEFPVSPYMYSANQNLLVEIVWGDNGKYTSDYFLTSATETLDYMMVYGYADSMTPPAYSSKSHNRPDIKLGITPWPRPVREEAELGSQVYTFSLSTAAAEPGAQVLELMAVTPQGKIVQTATLEAVFQGPAFQVTATPISPQLEVGETVTFTFDVKNIGDLAGTARLQFSLGDLTSQQKDVILKAGETRLVDFEFYVNDDLPSGKYRATYQVGTEAGRVDEQGGFDVTVQGIDIEVLTGFDQPYYREGEPVVMTFTVNNTGLTPTPDLYIEASFEGYTLTEVIQLGAGAQSEVPFPFAATFVGDTKVSFGVFNSQTQRAVLLNTAYLRQVRAGVTLTTDQEVYEPGESVVVTVVTTATGKLNVEAPGYSGTLSVNGGRLALNGGTVFTFTLPSPMNRGTYMIYYTLVDCGCIGEGEQHTYPFDVHSTEIRVTEVILDQELYQVGDIISATINVASTEHITLTLESWLVYPDGSEGIHQTQPVVLYDSLNNTYLVAHVVTSAQLGTHALAYRFYGPGNGLFTYRDVTNGDETVYAAGGELFDVGRAVLLSVATDQASYPGMSDPVQVTMQVEGFEATSGTLEILASGETIWTQAVSLAEGSNLFTATLTSGIQPGAQMLTGTLSTGGAVDVQTAAIEYGTNSPDLVPSTPWLTTEAGEPIARITHGQIRVMVTNLGTQPAAATTLEIYEGNPVTGTLLGSAAVPALGPAGQAQVYLPWSFLGQGGSHHLFVWVNPAGTAPEYNQENNLVNGLVTVPRLNMEVATGQAAYGIGEGIPVVRTVQNQDSQASLTFTMTTSIQEDTYNAPAIYTTTQVITLTAGETQNLPFQWNTEGLADGVYRIELYALDEYGHETELSTNILLELANLSLGLVVAPQEVSSQDAVLYQLQFANSSEVPAQNVTLVFTLPVGMSFSQVVTTTAALAGPSIQAGKLIWTSAALPANEQGEIGIELLVAATTHPTGTFTAETVIHTSTPETTQEDNEASAANQLFQYTDLVIDVHTNATEIDEGDTVVYTLGYSNLGPADAVGVTLFDRLPEEVVDVDCQVDQGSCLMGHGMVTATLGTVPAGASGEVTLTVLFSDTFASGVEVVVNFASIFSQVLDANALDNNLVHVGQVTPSGYKIFLPLVVR